MRIFLVLAVLGLALAVTGAAAITFWPLPVSPDLGVIDGDAKRGAYLLRAGGCVACHTRNDGDLLAGGEPLKSPFGEFRAPNITANQENGIGGWSLSDFARAVRQGVRPDGTPYYPAFPYEFYAAYSDQDVADMWSAIRSAPASAAASPGHALPFPFSIRNGVSVWRSFFAAPYRHERDNARSASWNRGRFFVEGPAHCGACHTPRNLIGGLVTDEALSGNPEMMDGSRAPGITASQLKERGWTVDTLRRALRTGTLHDGDAFGGSMAEVVEEGTSYMLTQHLEDIARYLLDVDE